MSLFKKFVKWFDDLTSDSSVGRSSSSKRSAKPHTRPPRNKEPQPTGPKYDWVRVEDRPDHLSKGTVYLIGDTAKPWRAAMVCPCGCGSSIDLSLVKDDDPSWQASVNAAGQISLHPSVWRTKGCCSHFILRNGGVHWTRSTNRTH